MPPLLGSKLSVVSPRVPAGKPREEGGHTISVPAATQLGHVRHEMAKKKPAPFEVPDGLFGKPLKVDITDPATAEEFARTEAALMVKLPAELLAVLRVRNGGQLRRTSLKLTPEGRKKYGRKRYSFTRLAGVHPTEGDGLTQQTATAREEWELPEGLIPLGGDGHTWCCLDYRVCGPKGEPSVSHIDLEGEQEFALAPTFAEFISNLVRDPDSWEPALIALDQGAPMGTMLDAALQALGCTVYTIPGGYTNPRFPAPPIWHWAKFQGALRDSPVWIQYERNKLYDVSIQKTPDRPAKHPMLTVAVAAADEDACLRELLAGLGQGAVLIHGMQ